MHYVNEKVRLYDEDGAYVDGFITSITENGITVDFLDWIEMFQSEDLKRIYPMIGLEMNGVNKRGVIVRDFRK